MGLLFEGRPESRRTPYPVCGKVPRRWTQPTVPSKFPAPFRPSWKERYPLVPIERYAAWRRADGLLFDPWMRVHERLGASVLKAEPVSGNGFGSGFAGRLHAQAQRKFGRHLLPRQGTQFLLDRLPLVKMLLAGITEG